MKWEIWRITRTQFQCKTIELGGRHHENKNVFTTVFIPHFAINDSTKGSTGFLELGKSHTYSFVEFLFEDSRKLRLHSSYFVRSST